MNVSIRAEALTHTVNDRTQVNSSCNSVYGRK